MRFKKRPQLPGAGRARAGHHHGSHMPTSPGAVLLGKMSYHPKHFYRQCTSILGKILGKILAEILKSNSAENIVYKTT